MGSSGLEHMHDVYPKEALARDIKQERCSLGWTGDRGQELEIRAIH